MDLLVLGFAVLSAACFLAFALRPRSSPSEQIDIVHPDEDDMPAPIFGGAAAPASKPVATTVVVKNPRWRPGSHCGERSVVLAVKAMAESVCLNSRWSALEASFLKIDPGNVCTKTPAC